MMSLSFEPPSGENHLAAPISLWGGTEHHVPEIQHGLDLEGNVYASTGNGQHLLPSEVDIVERLRMLSSDPTADGFARIADLSGTNRSRVGALPPGPATGRGDWFSKLQERARQLEVGLETSTISEAEAKEPAALDEWLKGRRILTVAQNGTGDFETINAALAAVESGQAVEVLDEGPYEEFLTVPAVDDIGLFSRCRTTVVLAKWEPNEWSDFQDGWQIENTANLRLSGLRFDFQSPGENEDPPRVALWPAKGLCIEDCEVICLDSRGLQCAIFPWRTESFSSIRNCLFHNVQFARGCPQARKHAAFVAQLFCESNGQPHAESVNTSANPTAETTAILRNNVFVSSHRAPVSPRLYSWGTPGGGRLVCDHNTFFNSERVSSVVTALYGVPVRDLEWTNNLVFGSPKIGINHVLPADQQQIAQRWRVRGNIHENRFETVSPDWLPRDDRALNLQPIVTDLDSAAVFRIPTAGRSRRTDTNSHPGRRSATRTGPSRRRLVLDPAQTLATCGALEAMTG